MGNTSTKETRSNSSTYAPPDPLSSPSRSRTDHILPQTPGESRSRSSRGSASASRHHGGHRKTKPAGYKMIIDRNESVDGGLLFPQGVYQGPQDFKVSVVREMIIQRRLAPFYKGLDGVEPDWTDEELLAAVNAITPLPKDSESPDEPAPEMPAARQDSHPSLSLGAPFDESTEKQHQHHVPTPEKPGPPTPTQQIWLYRNVHECPICFLDYPRLNATRCCGQGICTECFVNIKRNPPHPPYTTLENSEATDVLELVSEPSSCPYCAQSDLGVIFDAPPFEWGIPSSLGGGSGGQTPLPPSQPRQPQKSQRPPAPRSAPVSQNTRRTVPASHPSVVTVDMIRPDWEDKLASARRRLARKSAAARALHRSALLSNHDERRESPPSRGSSASDNTSVQDPHPVRPRHDVSLAEIMESSRSMSAAQTRALEKRMIEEAIKASLQSN